MDIMRKLKDTQLFLNQINNFSASYHMTLKKKKKTAVCFPDAYSKQRIYMFKDNKMFLHGRFSSPG